MSELEHSGLIALAGRPNVGKSTLLNRLVGRKISIVTSKPQTTRHRIIGIRTRPGAQLVFIDTPGLHRAQRKAMNRYMNRAAASVLADVDLVLMVVEAGRWTEDDELVLERLADVRRVGLAVNKVDRMKPREKLLPWLDEMSRRRDFLFVVPLSARKGENLEALETELAAHLPEGPPLYPGDMVTDQNERFFVAEVVREKLMQRLHQEVPYSLTVTVDEFRDEDSLLRIAATIWVERDGQKAIVIGKGGAVLKAVGRAARLDLEERFGDRVHLQLWVKVRDDWSDDERLLRSLGYEA